MVKIFRNSQIDLLQTAIDTWLNDNLVDVTRVSMDYDNNYITLSVEYNPETPPFSDEVLIHVLQDLHLASFEERINDDIFTQSGNGYYAFVNVGNNNFMQVACIVYSTNPDWNLGGGSGSGGNFWRLDGNLNGAERWIGTNDAFDFPVHVNSHETFRFGLGGVQQSFDDSGNEFMLINPLTGVYKFGDYEGVDNLTYLSINNSNAEKIKLLYDVSLFNQYGFEVIDNGGGVVTYLGDLSVSNNFIAIDESQNQINFANGNSDILFRLDATNRVVGMGNLSSIPGTYLLELDLDDFLIKMYNSLYTMPDTLGVTGNVLGIIDDVTGELGFISVANENFANANLTFTGDRNHNLDNHSLDIYNANNIYFQLDDSGGIFAVTDSTGKRFLLIDYNNEIYRIGDIEENLSGNLLDLGSEYATISMKINNINGGKALNLDGAHNTYTIGDVDNLNNRSKIIIDDGSERISISMEIGGIINFISSGIEVNNSATYTGTLAGAAGLNVVNGLIMA